MEDDAITAVATIPSACPTVVAALAAMTDAVVPAEVAARDSCAQKKVSDPSQS